MATADVTLLIRPRVSSQTARRRVRDDKPYFVAQCDCDWVGTAHDATEPHARDKAFREARGHGTEVAAEVDYPLG